MGRHLHLLLGAVLFSAAFLPLEGKKHRRERVSETDPEFSNFEEAEAMSGVEGDGREETVGVIEEDLADVEEWAEPTASLISLRTKEEGQRDKDEVPAIAKASFDPRLADPPCSWTAWSPCDAPCAGGAAFRLRRLGKACRYGPDQQIKTCNAQPCPQDCEAGPWSAWSACSVPCGGGKQSRARPVLAPSLFGGSACPAPLDESRDCNSQDCPRNCIAVSLWSAWGDCDVLCGGGRRARSRVTQFVVVVRPGTDQTEAECPAALEEEPCNFGPCPGDCAAACPQSPPFAKDPKSFKSVELSQPRAISPQKLATSIPQPSYPPASPALARSHVATPEEIAAFKMPEVEPIILRPLTPPLPPVLAAPTTTTEEPAPAYPPGFCADKPDGPYEHPDCLCCNDLIMCFQRQGLIKWCEPGSVFDATFGKCVPRAEATNCHH